MCYAAPSSIVGNSESLNKVVFDALARKSGSHLFVGQEKNDCFEIYVSQGKYTVRRKKHPTTHFGDYEALIESLKAEFPTFVVYDSFVACREDDDEDMGFGIFD